MTREELISICEKAIVQQSDWYNRDSAQSQIKVGQCWALLKAGCDFQVRTQPESESDNCVTDEDTIWLDITYHGFGFFEGHEPNTQIFYLPTMKRLERRGDWY